MLRGIRGATTVEANSEAEIINATRQLLENMVAANALQIDDLAAAFFSATPDLNAAFPARSARMLGWKYVPLFCNVEINVPQALPRCIRVLLLANTSAKPEQVKHIYLKESKSLREDLS